MHSAGQVPSDSNLDIAAVYTQPTDTLLPKCGQLTCLRPAHLLSELE